MLEPVYRQLTGSCLKGKRHKLGMAHKGRDSELTRRCLIFAHFNPQGGVAADLMDTLAWYRPHVARLVLVSTSPFSSRDRETLLTVCDDVIERDNTGYDFGSWKAGIESEMPLDGFDELVFANDSVVGPLAPADGLLDRVSALPQDVCGLVANWERGWHIQSWYVSYKCRAFQSEVFARFWASIEPCDSKQDLIERYEVGLTAAMREAGLTLGALYQPPRHVSLPRRLAIWARNASLREPDRSRENLRILWHLRTLNPTHFLWRDLLRSGIPFIKRELINSNPHSLNVQRIFSRYPRLRSPS